MGFFLSKFLPSLVLPDGMTCVLLIIVLLVMHRRPRVARLASAVALTVLLVASNPAASLLIMGFLEVQNLPRGALPPADAIVVLGGGSLPAEPPRPTIQLDAATANRLLYAIELYRERKAPLVILSGGPPPFAPTLPPQADQMDLVLQTMGVPKLAILRESSSHNTYESARSVDVILRNRQIHRILLVTSAFHMPRAMKVFRTRGINVIAAPCDFFTDAPPHFGTYKHWQSAVIASVPSAEALSETTLALRECLWWITNSL